MYIKRNVYFSAVDQKTGEEKLFSVNEVLTEDEYLERMYAQAEDENKSKAKTAAKVAGGVAGGAVAVGGAAYGGEKLLNKAGEKIVNSLAGKRGPNGKFAKLTPMEKKIKDLAVKARDTKSVQNVATKIAKKVALKK